MSILKVIPLGGAGEIGKNCTVVEQGDDIIVIDCGISFPHEEQHGIDIVIPDFTYLRQNKDRVKGIFITHAHEDHIGALSYLIPDLDCPVYATPLTEAFIRTRLEERIRMKNPNIITLSQSTPVRVGAFQIEPVRVTHSIPETMAMAVHTEYGVVLFTADFKFDNNPVDKKPSDLKRLAELGEEGVLLLLSDSTNVDREGWSPSESSVHAGLHKVIEPHPGRILVTMFSSNIHRMQQICDVSKELGRKICVAGRRMEQTFHMCRRLGYLHVTEDMIVPIEDINSQKADEITIIVTGSQGEPRAALSQMSRAEYTRLKVQEGDLIIYSARPIPGNEGGIWRTVNRLVKLGAKVHIDYISDVHASGHGSQEELKMMVRLTKPFYIAPVHGEPRHQQMVVDLLDQMDHPRHRRFIIANGDTLCMDDQKAWIGDSVQVGDVYLDQNGNHIVTEDILRERTTLATDGVFMVSMTVDTKAGAFESQPQAQTKGFIASRTDVEDILDDLCSVIAKLRPSEISQIASLEATITDNLRRAIWRRAKQSPIILVNIHTV